MSTDRSAANPQLSWSGTSMGNDGMSTTMLVTLIILDMGPDEEPLTGGRSPLSAKPAAYGESRFRGVAEDGGRRERVGCG